MTATTAIAVGLALLVALPEGATARTPTRLRSGPRRTLAGKQAASRRTRLATRTVKRQTTTSTRTRRRRIRNLPLNLRRRRQRALTFRPFQWSDVQGVKRTYLWKGRPFPTEVLMSNATQRAQYLADTGKTCVETIQMDGGTQVCLYDWLAALNKTEQEGSRYGSSLREDPATWHPLLRNLLVASPAFQAQASRILQTVLSVYTPTPAILAAATNTSFCGSTRYGTQIPCSSCNQPDPVSGGRFICDARLVSLYELQQHSINAAMERARAAQAAAQAAALEAARAINVTRNKSWDQEYGESGTLKAKFSAYLNIEHNMDKARADAGGDIDGWVLGEKFRIAHANAWLESNRRKVKAHAELEVLGIQVQAPKTWTEDHLDWEKTFKRTIEDGGSFTFWAGPIPVSVEMGFRGEVGLVLTVSSTLSKVVGTAKPYASLQGFLTAGVNLLVAGAYAEATLTFLEISVPGHASLELITTSSNGLQLKQIVNFNVSVRALSGRLRVCAWMHVPRWGLPPWEKKEWCANILDWPGFNLGNKTIYADTWTKTLL